VRRGTDKGGLSVEIRHWADSFKQINCDVMYQGQVTDKNARRAQPNAQFLGLGGKRAKTQGIHCV
jgi:hypothetical protein